VALAGVLLLLACADAAQAGGKPLPPAKTGKTGKTGGKVKIELQIASDHFLPGEQVPLTIQLVNAGSSDADLPLLLSPDNDQPVYTLTRPGQSQGETFSVRSAKWKEPGPIPPSPPAVRSVKAGESLKAKVGFQEWRSLDQPGRYTLQARLDWNGATVTSNVVTFTVESGSWAAAGVGVNPGIAQRGPVRVAWLAGPDGKRALGQTLIYEKRPDLGEVKVSGSKSIRPVGAGASEPFLPTANFDPSEGLWGWYGWREGGSLLALQLGATAPQSFDLGSPAAVLVRPALMAGPAGNLDQFVLSEGRNELRLVHFPYSDLDGPPGTPALKWKLPLPFTARAARGALGAVSQGSPRRVVLVSQDASGLVIAEVDAGDGGKAGPLRSLKVPGGQLLAQSEPGVAVDEQGATRVALVYGADHPAGVRLRLAEAVFPGPGHQEAPSVSTRVVASLEKTDKVTQAAATWRVPGTGPLQSQWLVMLETGEALSGTKPDQMIRFPSPPALPLEVLQLSSMAYVLLLNPGEGPFLHALP
jgi:hypothetical protein